MQSHVGQRQEVFPPSPEAEGALSEQAFITEIHRHNLTAGPNAICCTNKGRVFPALP